MRSRHMTLAAAAILAPSLALAAGAATFDRSMQPILKSYLSIQEALAADRLTGVEAAARAIAAGAAELDAGSVTGAHAGHYAHLPMQLRKAAGELAAARTLEQARAAFKALSEPVAAWATMAEPDGMIVVMCSMAKGRWVQKAGPVHNPYYGASMLGCGQVLGAAHDDMGMHGHMGMHGSAGE